MNLTVAIYNQKTLQKCLGFAKTAVLMCPKYAYIYEDDFDIDGAVQYCLNNSIDIVLAINRIFMEDELDDIRKFILKYKQYKFLISDLGVIKIFQELGLSKHVIYDPDTLICNSSDLAIYNSYGFDALGMSNEILINDVVASFEKTNAPIFYQVFGRKLMFYSKRKLLSLYEQYKQIEFTKKDLSLVEEKRSYHIPIFENENGIYCFRHYFISLLNEIDRLSFLKYSYVETITLYDDEVVSVLKAFTDNDINELNKLNLDIEDGFAYSDTVYVKEKIVQWERLNY